MAAATPAPSPRAENDPTELTKFGVSELDKSAVKPLPKRIENIAEAELYCRLTPNSLNRLNMTEQNSGSLRDI